MGNRYGKSTVIKYRVDMLTVFLSYSSIAVIKYWDQSNLEKEGCIWSLWLQRSQGPSPPRAESMAASRPAWVLEQRLSAPLQSQTGAEAANWELRWLLWPQSLSPVRQTSSAKACLLCLPYNATSQGPSIQMLEIVVVISFKPPASISCSNPLFLENIYRNGSLWFCLQ